MKKINKFIVVFLMIVALVTVLTVVDLGSVNQAQGASYTKLLVHSDSSSTETTIFTDFSDSAHSITATGDVVHDRDGTPAPTLLNNLGGNTAQSTIEFDGTGDYLSIADSTDFILTTNDFTIEAFVYTGAAGTIFSQLTGDATGLSMKWEIDASDRLELSLSDDGTTWGKTVTSTTLVGSAAAWVHVAATRYNNGTTDVVTQYIGGVADATTLDVSTFDVIDSGGALEIGSASTETSEVEFTGHMQEPRISNGVARWTAGFTPPTVMYGSSEYDQVTLSVDVQEVLVLNCGADVDLGTLNPGTPITGTTTCQVTTNAQSGYSLEVVRDDVGDTTLDHTSDAASNITDASDWDEAPATSEEFTTDTLAFRVYDGPDTGWQTDWDTDTTCPHTTSADADYSGFPATYQEIYNYASYSSAATSVNVCYIVDVGSTQKSGDYDGTITYQATTNP